MSGHACEVNTAETLFSFLVRNDTEAVILALGWQLLQPNRQPLPYGQRELNLDISRLENCTAEQNYIDSCRLRLVTMTHVCASLVV